MLNSITAATEEPKLNLTRFASLKFARLEDFLESFNKRSIDEARARKADVLVFCDRPWMGEQLQLPLSDKISIAVLSFKAFEDWFSGLKKDTRNEIRKGEKVGVENRTIGEPSESDIQGIVDLFRESPFREGRYFEGYHFWNQKNVKTAFRTNENFVSIVAVHKGRIIGVTRARFKGEVGAIKNLVSGIAIRRKIKGVSNSLLATMIQILGERGVKHLTYGKLGVLEGLDHFRITNGFRPVTVNYNYELLTRRARLCARFGIYQPRDLMFSTKLRFVVPLSASIQPHVPIKLVQKLHLYA